MKVSSGKAASQSLRATAARTRSASRRQSSRGARRSPSAPLSARSAMNAWRIAVPCADQWLEPDFADRRRRLDHFLGAAPAVLDHALEEVGALALPVDAGKGFGERCEHESLDAIGARGDVAFDDHRFQALDHHAAAHLGRRGDAELHRRDRRREAQRVEQRQDGFRMHVRRAASVHGCDAAAPKSSPRPRRSVRRRRRSARPLSSSRRARRN